MTIGDYEDGAATFVIPHRRYEDDKDITKRYLDETLENIFNQTDKNWQLVIIDDNSPCKEAIDYLDEVKARDPARIHVIKKDTWDGPGVCRNEGIEWAYNQGSPLILFNDADDISDKRRLEVARKIFVQDPEASVVYSTFKVIDEGSNIVPRENLTQSIVEILEGHEKGPPEGINAWIDIGTERGYTNLTSATVVDTALAYGYPFPPLKVSEDSHTWMRYSAAGGKFVYCKDIPTLYRIPQHTAGSSSRSREGGKHGFYREKARVDTDGFTRALEIALRNKKIEIQQRPELLIRFYLKLGETMYRENETDLAKEQVENAKRLNSQMAESIIQKRFLMLGELLK